MENDSLKLWRTGDKLEWSDFKGKLTIVYGKVMGVHQAAASATGPIFVHREDINGNMVPYPLAYFYKNISWTISKDSLLLEHERLHFDIKELFVRKIRKKFKNLIQQNVYDSDAYAKFSDEILKECSEMQNNYDKEVSFNRIKQNEWKQFINKEQEKLKEFEYAPSN